MLQLKQQSAVWDILSTGGPIFHTMIPEKWCRQQGKRCGVHPLTKDVDFEIDARDLDCPMPLLKAKRQMNTMEPGQVLRVLATDPGSVRDFHSWAEHGNLLLEFVSEDEALFSYTLTKQIAI
jgi:tRNA 2-thiouridine synthesizing protein A